MATLIRIWVSIMSWFAKYIGIAGDTRVTSDGDTRQDSATNTRIIG